LSFASRSFVIAHISDPYIHVGTIIALQNSITLSRLVLLFNVLLTVQHI
jgi:hypothetical protein